MQYFQDKLDRRNLSNEIADLIREMIFDGRLPASKRLNEVHLAIQLGVSRTPLREALASLTSEGALSNVPRQGYYISPLTLEEARQIYPIRALLDPEALALSGIPSADNLSRLETITKKLSSSKTVKQAIDLDEKWHRVLWGDCPNRVLIDLIEQFMRRTKRYELASMRNPKIIQSSVKSKRLIQSALSKKKMTEACSLLRKSLINGGKPVYLWLEETVTDREEKKL